MNCSHFLMSKEFGGAAHVALQLADRLQSSGHRQIVWAPGGGPAREEAHRRCLETRTFDVERLFRRSRFISVAENLSVAWGLRDLEPGLVHVHGPALYGAMTHALRLRGRGLIRVAHVHIEESPEALSLGPAAPTGIDHCLCSDAR